MLNSKFLNLVLFGIHLFLRYYFQIKIFLNQLKLLRSELTGTILSTTFLRKSYTNKLKYKIRLFEIKSDFDTISESVWSGRLRECSHSKLLNGTAATKLSCYFYCWRSRQCRQWKSRNFKWWVSHLIARLILLKIRLRVKNKLT